jgi:MarR family transcriptional regulator, organic hydroperoxide resistance regulator
MRKQVGDFWSQVEKIGVGGLSDQERQTVLRVIENMEERLSERRSVKDPNP